MRKVVHIRVASLLVAILLFANVFPTAATVLCIGPGHHCHFENPVGDSCGSRAAVPRHSAPKEPDGCPKGSRDVALCVPARPTERGISALTFSSPFAVLASKVVILVSPARPFFGTVAHAATPQRPTMTILRC